MKSKVLTIPIWERDIHVLLGGDYNDILAKAKSLKLSQPVYDEILYDKLSYKDSLGGAYFCLDKGVGLIWFPTKKVLPGIFVHEVVHIIDWLSQFVGMEREMEARAYTAEWLYNKVPEILRKM
jgi:hypothetical protein